MDIDALIDQCEKQLKSRYKIIEYNALINQERILNAFINNRIAPRHFAASTGYGYGDEGRDALNRVFAESVGGEDAIVTPLLVSGTHAITTALFGVLRPNQTCLSLTGKPYDTLLAAINGKDIGSLKDYNIGFDCIALKNGKADTQRIQRYLQANKPALLYIQRSKGYEWRGALSIDDIKNLIETVRRYSDAPVMIDNCYGEFTDTCEPLSVGADIIAGSLIKNPGGGLAPTGGYIAGKKVLIEKIENRLTAPSIGRETGSYNSGYREIYQGLFLAPHVTAQAMKGAQLFGKVLSTLGYKALYGLEDIICAVRLDNEQKLIGLCKAVQAASPVDGFVTPEPWDMPGYSHKVIMAAGAFVQGASIELSADAPVTPPYIAYIQGGLTYEHIKIALKRCLEAIL